MTLSAFLSSRCCCCWAGGCMQLSRTQSQLRPPNPAAVCYRASSKCVGGSGSEWVEVGEAHIERQHVLAQPLSRPDSADTPHEDGQTAEEVGYAVCQSRAFS